MMSHYLFLVAMIMISIINLVLMLKICQKIMSIIFPPKTIKEMVDMASKSISDEIGADIRDPLWEYEIRALIKHGWRPVEKVKGGGL